MLFSRVARMSDWPILAACRQNDCSGHWKIIAETHLPMYSHESRNQRPHPLRICIVDGPELLAHKALLDNDPLQNGDEC